MPPAKRKPRFSPVGHTGPSADAALQPGPAVVDEPPAEAPAPAPAEQPAPAAADPVPPAIDPAPAPAKRTKAAQTAAVPEQPARRTPDPEPAVPASQTVDGPAASAFTWRQTLDQVDQLDDLRRDMRRTTGNRRLDKATILAALVDLAATDDTVRATLVDYLRRTS